MAGEEVETPSKFTLSRVHVRPGKPFAFGEGAVRWTNCLANVPTIEGIPANYSPMPYTFRLPPAPKPTRIGKVECRCPPFYLLLDHTIAVIWLLWSAKEETAPLGITQLHWALAFLKTIYNRKGEHPTDVELTIDKIEDVLFDEYAKLYEENSKLSTLNETFRYADGAVFSKSIITTHLPFSLNHSKLEKTLGSGLSTTTKTDGMGAVASITSADAEARLETLKKGAGVPSILYLDDQDKRNAVDVLKAWHARQTKRIMTDMRKLKKIESKIKRVDEGDFPYMDKDQLDSILQTLEEDEEEEEA